MADDSGIDPRYAAQFQRGFDPAVHAPAPVVRDAVPRRAAPVRLAGGPEPTAERVPDRPVARERHAPLAIALDATSTSEPEELAGEPTTPRRRPIVEWVLLGLGPLQLLAAYVAVWAQWNSQQVGGLSFGPGLDGMMFFVLSSYLPGPLFVGGVVAVMLWIVVRALDRRSR